MQKTDAVRIWGSIASLARDIGVEPSTVRNWFNDPGRSIPGRYDAKIVEAARARGHELSFEALARRRADAAQARAGAV